MGYYDRVWGEHGLEHVPSRAGHTFEPMQLLLPTLDTLAALHRRSPQLSTEMEGEEEERRTTTMTMQKKTKVKAQSQSKAVASTGLLDALAATQAELCTVRARVHALMERSVESARADDVRALRRVLADSSVTHRFAVLERGDSDISRRRARRARVDEEATCSTCAKEDSEFGNAILICETCEGGWHQKCYCVAEIPTGDWLCSPCTAVKCAPLLRLLSGAPSELELVVTQKAGSWKRMALELLDVQGISDRISDAQQKGHLAKPPLSQSFIVEQLAKGITRCRRYTAAPWLRLTRTAKLREQRRCLNAAQSAVCALVRRAFAEMSSPLPINFVASDAAAEHGAADGGGARSPMRSPMRSPTAFSPSSRFPPPKKGPRDRSAAAVAESLKSLNEDNNFCLCKKEWKADQADFMLGCSNDCCRGGAWFHPRCLGLAVIFNSAAQAIALRHPDSGETTMIDSEQEWLCPNCIPDEAPPVSSRKRILSSEDDEVREREAAERVQKKQRRFASSRGTESKEKDPKASRPRQMSMEQFFFRKEGREKGGGRAS